MSVQLLAFVAASDSIRRSNGRDLRSAANSIGGQGRVFSELADSGLLKLGA